MSKDKTNPQRQATARKRLIDEGGRRLTVAVPGPINAKLEAEMHRTGESASAIVLRLLQNSLPQPIDSLPGNG